MAVGVGVNIRHTPEAWSACSLRGKEDIRSAYKEDIRSSTPHRELSLGPSPAHGARSAPAPACTSSRWRCTDTVVFEKRRAHSNLHRMHLANAATLSAPRPVYILPCTQVPFRSAIHRGTAQRARGASSGSACRSSPGVGWRTPGRRSAGCGRRGGRSAPPGAKMGGPPHQRWCLHLVGVNP